MSFFNIQCFEINVLYIIECYNYIKIQFGGYMRDIKGEEFVITLCIFGTVLIVPFIYLPIKSIYDFFYFPKYITLVLITFSLLILIIRKPAYINEFIKFDIINKFLLSYFILITISLFFSLDPELSIQGRTLRYDGYSTQMMYIILFLFARTIKCIDNKFIHVVCISSAILATYGILQYFGFDPFIRDLTRMHWTSAFSTFGNQNFFGAYLVLQIPFSLYTILINKKKWAYITYSLTLLALLMTMTRSAWIGFLILFIILFFYLIRKNSQYKSILLVTFIVLVGFNLLNNNQLFDRFMTLINDMSILNKTPYLKSPEVIEQLGSYRIFIWIRVLEMIKMRPFFGFGIENLALVFEKYYFSDIIKLYGSYAVIDKAHNDYLHIAVSSGIPSLIAYLTFLVTVLYLAMKRFKQEINIIIFASILGYITCLFFNISVISVAYIFWIYLGLLCKIGRASCRERV